jgi:hypothetical protein
MPKISNLTSQSTPTIDAVVPIVQSGSTFKATLLSFFDTLAGFLPSGTAAVYRTITAKFRETVSVYDFGAVGDGVTDDTTAIQRAANATDASQILWFPEGTFLVSTLTMIPDSHWSFAPGAKLKASTNSVPVIRTRTGASQANLTGNVRRLRLDNPRIDMDNRPGVAILFEGVTHSVIDKPYILNVGDDAWSYTDLHGTANYPSCGIMVKGVHGTQGCYYNRIRHGQVTSSAAGNNAGYWLGTSLTGDDQRANMTTLQECFVSGCGVGIELDMGGDNRFVQCEVSSNTTGIKIGRSSGTTVSRRTRITLPYMEFNTTGIDITTNARDTSIIGIGSTSGTTTILNDNGVGTSYDPSNTDALYLNGDITKGWFARIYRYGLRLGPYVNGLGDKETDVNTLDNYQEGTFTPIIIGSSTTGSTTYATQTGVYTLIGNRCYFDITLVYSASTATGNLRINGLPFTSTANESSLVVRSAGLTLTAGNMLQAYTFPSTTQIILHQMPTGGGTPATVPVAGNTAGTIKVSGSYPIY